MEIVRLTSVYIILLFLSAFMIFPAVLVAGGPPVPASEVEKTDTTWYVPVRLVSLINKDDQGKPLHFPSTLFSDPVMSEIYVVTGGESRIIIYGDNFFPLVSLGKGRGVDTPRGLHVDSDGRLFICQGDSVKSQPRLTILNGSLFKQQEIFMSDIPGAENFIPYRITSGRNGTLYLAGLNYRGILILDKNGIFIRWLKPEDKIWTAPTGEESEFTMETMKKSLEGSPDRVQEIPSENLEEDLAAKIIDLPPELTPEIGRIIDGEDDTVSIGPVQISDLTTDSDGHLYLLSEETGKVYVYGADDELLFSFGKKGGSAGKLSRPRGLALDEKKRCVYVVDYMRHTILVYDLSGRFLFEFGGMGTAPRWFNFPTDITVDAQGRVIVADLFNQRVQVLELEFPPSYPLFAPSSK
jgi:hypothetical protein